MTGASSGINFSGVAKLGEFDPFVIERVVSKLSFVQKLTFKLQGNIEVGYIHMSGWKSEIPCYLIKCEEHGHQITTVSGHYMMLHCPRCIKDRQTSIDKEIPPQNSESAREEPETKYEVHPLPLPNMKDYK